jgi:hypothetical protein
MKTIKLSDEELMFLRQQYTEELAQAQKYLAQIKDVLKKLGGPVKVVKEVSLTDDLKVVKKRGPKPKVKTLEPKVPKKRGRKPKNVVEQSTSEPSQTKKRGRKSKSLKKVAKVAPAVIIKDKPTKKSTTKIKVVSTVTGKKKIRKKSNRKGRSKGRVTLVSLRKPLKLKKAEIKPGPAAEEIKEIVPKVEPVTPANEGPKE